MGNRSRTLPSASIPSDISDSFNLAAFLTQIVNPWRRMELHNGSQRHCPDEYHTAFDQHCLYGIVLIDAARGLAAAGVCEGGFLLVDSKSASWQRPDYPLFSTNAFIAQAAVSGARRNIDRTA